METSGLSTPGSETVLRSPILQVGFSPVYCKSGYVRVGEIYTIYAVSLKPRKITPARVVNK